MSNPLRLLWGALFLDLVGFGMAFPDIQLRLESMGAPGWLIGAILSSMFLIQLLVSPHWGRLSDRIGRKVPLVVCTALSALSMVVYGLANSMGWIALSRVLAGLASANVAVGQALVTDLSSEETRVSALGKIGAAVTAGIMLGPALGGFISERFGSHVLGFVAAACSGLGTVLLLFLPNPKPDPSEEAIPPKRMILDLRLLREETRLRPLFLLAAVSWFALACLEGTFGRLLEAQFPWPNAMLGIPFEKPVGASGAIFSVESLIGVLVQGFLLTRLEKKLDVRQRLRLGYAMQGIGLMLTPFAPGLGIVLLFSAIYSVGIGIANPTVNAACSSLVTPSRQGELFGLLQGARSIGFLVGPVLGGTLFDLNSATPYLVAGGVGILAAVLAAGLVSREPVPQVT